MRRPSPWLRRPRPMSKTLFLTGASGFVGSAALQHVMENTDWRVICPSTIRHYGSQSRPLELREKYGNRIRVGNGRASCRERGGPDVEISVIAVTVKKKKQKDKREEY